MPLRWYCVLETALQMDVFYPQKAVFSSNFITFHISDDGTSPTKSRNNLKLKTLLQG